MEKRYLPSIGTVTKKEQLSVADHIVGVSVMIFETSYPYSGYYGTTVPDNFNALSYFPVTRLKHSDDQVIRAIQKVKHDTDLSFDAVPGHISFSNKLYGVIRLRCVTEEQIPDIIAAFEKAGIDFMPAYKQSPVEALIHITKYFNTEEVEDGIFLDTDNSSFAYLKINRRPDWNEFHKYSEYVKNNAGDFRFDAALSIMYDRKGIIDLVRIYDEKRSLDKLRAIHKRYLEAIR